MGGTPQKHRDYIQKFWKEINFQNKKTLPISVHSGILPYKTAYSKPFRNRN